MKTISWGKFILAGPLFMAMLATGSGFTILEKRAEPIDSSKVRRYFQHVYRAEDFLISGQIDSAFVEYTRAKQCSLRYNNDIVNEGKCLYATQNEDLKVQYLGQGFLYNHDSVTAAMFVSRVSYLLSEEGAGKLFALIDGKSKIHFDDPVDYEKISATLEPLLAKDQQYRTPGNEPKNEKENKNMKQIDEENLQTIMNFYKKWGSFSTMKLSADAYHAYITILHHALIDQKLQIKNHPVFFAEILKGNMDPRDYAKVVDHYRYDSTQMYGDHTMFFTGDSLFVYNLSESGAKRINSEREQIFLQDIDLTQKKLIWQWKNQDKYHLGLIWEVYPEGEGSALKYARKQMQSMGKMVTGFDIITR